MVNRIKRKLYKRGSSFETTIPMPMLFGLDPSKKYYVVFNYKPFKKSIGGKSGEWVVGFEERKFPSEISRKNKRRRK